jgi:hypothetical protein
MSTLRDSGRARLSRVGLEGPAEPRDDLLRAVRETAGTDFEVFGEIGRAKDGTIAYLARDRSDQKLVALRLTPDAHADNEYGLDLARELDDSVPPPSTLCPRCDAPLRSWGRFCTQCGLDLWTDPRAGQPRSKDDLLAAVREATSGKFEVLGEMTKAGGGGLVYFARDLATGRIEALRLRREGDEAYSIGLTGVLRSVADSIAKYPRVDPPKRR